MVTHDMGSIIKYCDKVVLLHKGEFIAEGPAGKVVDMYKRYWLESWRICGQSWQRKKHQKMEMQWNF